MRIVVTVVTSSRTGWLRIKFRQVIIVVTGELKQVVVAQVVQNLGQLNVIPAAKFRRPIRYHQIRLGLGVGIRRPAAQHRHQPATISVGLHTIWRRLPCLLGPLPLVQTAMPGDQPAGPLIQSG